MINVGQNEIKDYVASSRACSVSGKGYSLDNDKSTVHLKFEQHKPNKFSISILRGRGSDGKVIVNGNQFLLQPNRPKKIDLPGSEISVSRPRGAYGEIYITGISLDDESKEEKVVMQIDWNDFLKRIGRVKGIKRTDLGIMAAEYAEITNGDEIIDMQTDPPASFKRVGNKIVFIHPCRIFEVKMKGDKPPPEPKIPFFMKDPSDKNDAEEVSTPEPEKPLVTRQVQKVSPIPTVSIKQKKQPATTLVQPQPAPITRFQNEVFSSNILKSSNVNEPLDLGQSDAGVVLKHKGRFSIPVSAIKPKTSYVISVRGKKISGNGKIGIQLVDSGKVKSNMIFSLKQLEKNITIKLFSGDRSGFSTPYNLVVFRPLQASTGEILIKEIKVFESTTSPVHIPQKPVDMVIVPQDPQATAAARVAKPDPMSVISSPIPRVTREKSEFDWRNVTDANSRPWPNVTPCFVNTDYSDKEASILVTSFNRPNLLRLGLSSISKQKFDKNAVEIIVLNDYLPDETEKVCQEFKDLNIKYIYTGQRNIQGLISRAPSYALNVGAKIAKGKYLFITCAEIYHFGNTIQNMLNKLKEGKNIVTTCCGYEDSGRVVSALEAGREFHLKNEQEMDGMHLPYFLGLHKNVYFEIGGYDEDFIGLAADDNDFAERLVAHGCNYETLDDKIIHLHHDRLLSGGKGLSKKHNNKENALRLSYNRRLYRERKDQVVRNKNGWGNVNIVNRNKEWHLKRIPKKAHFYWGGDKMPFLRYLTIKSFIKHNPDWEVFLHKPATFGTIVPTWRTAEQKQSAETHKVSLNYYEEAEKLGAKVIQHDFQQYGIQNNLHEVHKSDFLRWRLLAIEGGIWSDMDVLFTRPMTDMIENTPSNANINVGLCRYHDGAHAIGFLMSSENNSFFHKVFERSKKCFNRSGYQSIGSAMMHRYFRDNRRIATVAPDAVVLFLDMKTVYSVTSIRDFLSDDNYIEDYPDAIGFHWYGGHPETSKVEAIVNQQNYMEHSSFLGKLVLYTMGAK